MMSFSALKASTLRSAPSTALRSSSSRALSSSVARLHLGVGLHEDFGHRVGDERGFFGALRLGADRDDETLVAALDGQRLEEVVDRQHVGTVRSVRRRRRLAAGHDLAQERPEATPAGPLAVELGIVGKVEPVDDLGKNRSRRQHAHLVLDQRQRGIPRQSAVGEFPLGQLEIARIDDHLRPRLEHLRRRKRDGNAGQRADQGGRGNQELGPGDPAHDRHRLEHRLARAVVPHQLFLERKCIRGGRHVLDGGDLFGHRRDAARQPATPAVDGRILRLRIGSGFRLAVGQLRTPSGFRRRDVCFGRAFGFAAEPREAMADGLVLPVVLL